MPVTNNNYNFTNIVYEIPEDAIISGLHPTAVITIVPNSGYNATASNFSMDPSFSDPLVLSVVFTQDGLNVLCTVTFVTNFVMPSSNYTINLCVIGDADVNLITVAGTINATVTSNINGNGSETNTPYSNSGVYQEIESLFVRTYNADTGYYLEAPTANIVTGNQSNYTIAQTPTYDLNNNLTNISYNVSYIYPLQNVSGDSISFQVAAKAIFTQAVEITAIPYSGWFVPQLGETRALEIFGIEGAVYSITATDGTITLNVATNVTMDASGYQQQLVEFPATVSTKTWTFAYSGDIGSSVTPNPLVVNQLGLREIVFEPKPSSIFNGGFDVIQQFTSISEPNPGSSSSIATLQWIISSVSGDPMSIFNPLSNVVWEGNESITQQVISASGTSMTLDSTTGITAGMRFNSDGATQSTLAYTVVSVDSATGLTVTPSLTISNSIGITFTNNNGFSVDTTGLVAVYSNSDQSSITISGDIIISNYGDTDTAMLLDFSDWISVLVSIPCSSAVTSGGMGITDNNIDLDPAGGLIAFLVGAYSVPDKFEIIHNAAKKATSGMSVLNSGTYDNVYGTSPSNTIPTYSQTTVTDQFIGTAKGTIPTRQAAFTAATSNTVPSMTVNNVNYQQIIWFEYTAADYLASPFAQLRTTGPSGTGWGVLRLCCPDINCTGATASAPTISTTSITNITNTTADVGGELISDNGSAITVRGIQYDTDKFFSSPSTYIDPLTGTADFSATITNLTACTTYWFRAYATNSIGTTYANAVSATTTGCTAAPFPITTDSYPTSSGACLQGTLQSLVYFEGDTFATGKVAYTDVNLSNPFIGDGDWYNINTAANGSTATRVSSTGVVGPIASICSIQP
jgi:hypothetical protein